MRARTFLSAFCMSMSISPQIPSATLAALPKPELLDRRVDNLLHLMGLGEMETEVWYRCHVSLQPFHLAQEPTTVRKSEAYRRQAEHDLPITQKVPHAIDTA